MWDKPALPSKNLQLSEMYKIGEEVLYRFPGRRMEDLAIVRKIRFDDQTGEGMYDLENKYNSELYVKWVSR